VRAQGSTVEEIVEAVARLREGANGRSVLVGVSGIDGSGKGFVSARLADALMARSLETAVVNIDPWLSPPSVRFGEVDPGAHFYRHAFDFGPLFEAVVRPLRAHRRLHIETTLSGEFGDPFLQRYDYEDVDVVLLEGIFLFRRDLREEYDLRVWIETSFETALARALLRGQEGLPRDETVRAYEKIYFPAQRHHFLMDDPKGAADLTYDNDR
jgi:uridine kinase